MRRTHTQQRLLTAGQRLVDFEQHASAHGRAGAADPILADLRQCIAVLEQQAVARPAGPAHDADIRTSLGSLTARLSELEFSAVPWVTIDLGGYISDANTAMAQLLNVSVRYLRGRPLPLFIAEERDGFRLWLQALRFGGTLESAAVLLRPRERRPTHVSILGGIDSENRITLLMCELHRKAA